MEEAKRKATVEKMGLALKDNAVLIIHKHDGARIIECYIKYVLCPPPFTHTLTHIVPRKSVHVPVVPLIIGSTTSHVRNFRSLGSHDCHSL